MNNTNNIHVISKQCNLRTEGTGSILIPTYLQSSALSMLSFSSYQQMTILETFAFILDEGSTDKMRRVTVNKFCW